MGNEKQQPQKNYWLVFGLVFLIALFAFMAFSYNDKPKSSVTGNVINDLKDNSKNCREIQVPYEEIEYEQEAYPDTEYYEDYLEAVVVERTRDTGINLQYGAYASSTVKLKNTDNEAGWFTVTFRWETLKDGTTDNEVRHFIEPDETITFHNVYDIDSGEDYSVTHAFQSDPIQKSRVVTKYRDVPKKVTKYKTETKCD